MPGLIRMAHDFLRNFCGGRNRENQVLLHQRISIGSEGNKSGFLKVETVSVLVALVRTSPYMWLAMFQVDEVATLISIFRNNRDLCANASDRLIHHIVQMIEQQSRNAIFLQLLQTLVMIDDRNSIAICQEKVAQEVKAGLWALFWSDLTEATDFRSPCRAKRSDSSTRTMRRLSS